MFELAGRGDRAAWAGAPALRHHHRHRGRRRARRRAPRGGPPPPDNQQPATAHSTANAVARHNCSARPTHKYLDFDAGRDFEREIVVKVNAPERLRVELARPSWKGEHVALGTNTDPYQWA